MRRTHGKKGETLTRMCCVKDCKAPHLGEVCPECGSKLLMLLDSPELEVPDWFECHKGHVFQEGMTLDPPQITHGYCNYHLEKRRQEVMEKTA